MQRTITPPLRPLVGSPHAAACSRRIGRCLLRTQIAGLERTLGELEGTLGAAESHGCIRLAAASIDWLAARIDPGTPVKIYSGSATR
jgi:hypothetical protein